MDLNARECCDLTRAFMLNLIQSQDDLRQFEAELEEPLEFAWCGLILASDDTFVDSRIRSEDKGIVLKPRDREPLPFSAMLEGD